jgi:hypothetical protein
MTVLRSFPINGRFLMVKWIDGFLLRAGRRSPQQTGLVALALPGISPRRCAGNHAVRGRARLSAVRAPWLVVMGGRCEQAPAQGRCTGRSRNLA